MRLTSSGALDTTFDGDGKVDTALGAGGANEVFVLSSGKILAVGKGGTNCVAARYNSDGSLDTSFDSDGFVAVAVGASGYCAGAAVQPDGKVVLAGSYTQGSSYTAGIIIRLNADGSLDNGFGSSGVAIVAHATSRYEGFGGVSVQADGKLVAVGSSDYYGMFSNANHYIVRFNANGTLDTSFDGDGVIQMTGTANMEGVSSVAIQTDGRIIAAGYEANGTMLSRQDNDILLLRFNP